MAKREPFLIPGGSGISPRDITDLVTVHVSHNGVVNMAFCGKHVGTMEKAIEVLTEMMQVLHARAVRDAN